MMSSKTIFNSISMPAVATRVSRVWQHVKSILLLIRGALVEPEKDTTDKRQASNNRVVPDEQGVLS